MSDGFKKSYPPIPSSVVDARSELAHFAAKQEFDQCAVDDLKIALSEVCSNIVEHSRSSTDYVVDCEFEDNTLSIVVEDNGVGFERSPREKVRQLTQVRGLGIYLVSSLMDRVTYEHKPGDGTRVTLQKRHVNRPLKQRTFAATDL